MTALVEVRERVREIYAEYDNYIASAWKFVLALFSFILINGKLGYMDRLNSFFIVLILALFCSFLPVNAIVLFGTGLVIGHLYGLSIPALLVGGGIIVMMLLLYFGTSAQEGYALVLTMLTLSLGMPCAVPLIFGLISGPLAAAAICFGTISYYTLYAISNGTEAAAVAGSATAAEESQAMVENIQKLLDGVIKEEKMVLMLVAMVAVLLVVYLIRRMAVRHAWTLAIGAGTLTFFIIGIIGSLILGSTEGLLGLILGTAFSAAVAFGVKFMLLDVDYEKTQSVQFEDGEYYYYVKAVPKIKKGREKSGDR